MYILGTSTPIALWVCVLNSMEIILDRFNLQFNENIVDLKKKRFHHLNVI